MRGKYVVGGLLTALVAVSMALAYSNGPSDKRTGAPGESTCATCHQNLNTGGGTIQLFGPSSFSPGDTLPLRVALSMPGQRRWGFELTVLDSRDSGIGTIVVADTLRTQLSDNENGRQYLKHTSAGTDSGMVDSSRGWELRWVAPETLSGPVTFYFAGNAADGDGSVTGDYIYTAKYLMHEQCCAGTLYDLDQNGLVNLADLTLLVSYIVRHESLDCIPQADFDQSGHIDLTDLSVCIYALTTPEYILPPCPQGSPVADRR